MDLNDIKKKFENKSFLERIDFIEDYDFQDNYKDYYLNFIKNYKKENNPLYFSSLIELSTFLYLDDENIYHYYLGLLFKNSHYLTRLSIVDYLLTIEKTYTNKKNFEIAIGDCLKTRLFLILKNQILLLLISLNSEKLYVYKNTLLDSLNSTNDYRSHIRVIKTLQLYKERFLHLDLNYHLELIKCINNKSKSIYTSEINPLKEAIDRYKINTNFLTF